MSSTDSTEKLRAFYREVLVPSKVEQTLELDLDGTDSWYRPPHDTAELVAIDDFAVALAEHWKTAREPALAAIAPRLGEIASELEVADEGCEDVSPFIYVMY